MFSNNECSIVEFDCYLRERTVPILRSFIEKNQMSVRFYFRIFSRFLSRTMKPQNEIEYENKFWKVEFDSCFYIQMESLQWENWMHLFCRKVSFLTAPHCQFWDVGQGMKQTIWYPLFQAQWDRCYQGFIILWPI